MEKATAKKNNRARRHARIRARVRGTESRPRLAVFRSNQALYVQLIDDEQSNTIVAADSRKEKGATLRERSTLLGVTVGAKAKEKGIEKVVFDRGGFRYQGAIAAFAESARSAGLAF
ncbi:50S ribosomal protein L18 [Candidatus Kaiserbacteria bacterium]|nr:50S ribosomal protein L18 [Candidatus Kaiserbacteria bacterium]